jgi:hypothetical protein
MIIVALFTTGLIVVLTIDTIQKRREFLDEGK